MFSMCGLYGHAQTQPSVLNSNLTAQLILILSLKQ